MYLLLQTPTKSTTKNNVPIQVRTPEFSVEDEKVQLIQTLSIVNATNNDATMTPRTKRRLQLMQDNNNIEQVNIENRQIPARERMAAKRDDATPEEIERQKMLARERSAARRAARTPEQIERDRSLARERSAARRAAFTQEEIEQERVISRERTAVRRATLTPDEIEHQRTLSRERNAAKRATFTPEEIDRHRAFAAVRSMSKRATASPKEAEEERILARNRSAARRATYTSDELKQQRELARERNRLQNIEKRKKKMKNRGIHTGNGIEWPNSIEMECKITCIKNFIQQMSMNSLVEGVCGICNVRCYMRDLHHVPFNKIPSIELLTIHNDLKSLIPQTQKVNSSYSNDKINWNHDVGLALARDDKEKG